MLAELENISYYVQTPGHNKRFPGHNSGGISGFQSIGLAFLGKRRFGTGNASGVQRRVPPVALASLSYCRVVFL